MRGPEERAPSARIAGLARSAGSSLNGGATLTDADARYVQRPQAAGLGEGAAEASRCNSPPVLSSSREEASADGKRWTLPTIYYKPPGARQTGAAAARPAGALKPRRRPPPIRVSPRIDQTLRRDDTANARYQSADF